METSIEKKLIFFKAKIRQTLDGLRPDIGDLRYRLYTSMVEECNDLDELCEMAELEMQIDLVKYTKQAITEKLEEKDVNIRDLRKVCYPPYDNIEAIEEEDETSASMNDPDTLAMLAMALQKRLEEEPPEETRGTIDLDDDCLLTEEEQIANMLIQAEQDELNNEESLRNEYGDEPSENDEDDIEISLEDFYTDTDEDIDDTESEEHEESSIINGLSDKEISYGPDGKILNDSQEIEDDFDSLEVGIEGLEGYIDEDSDDDTLDSENDDEIEIDLDSEDEDIIDDEDIEPEDNEDDDDSEEGFSLDELELIPDSDIFIDEEENPDNEDDDEDPFSDLEKLSDDEDIFIDEEDDTKDNEDPFSDIENISDEDIFIDEEDDTKDEDDFDIDTLSDEDYFVEDGEDKDEESEDDEDPFSDIKLDEDEEDIIDDEPEENDEDPFSDLKLDEDIEDDEESEENDAEEDEDPFSDITLDEDDIEEDTEDEEDEDSFEIEGLDELEVPEEDEPPKVEEDIIDFGGAPIKPIKRTDTSEKKAVFTKGEHAAETQKIYDTYGKIADKLGFMSKRAVKQGAESIKKQVNTSDYYRRPKEDE